MTKPLPPPIGREGLALIDPDGSFFVRMTDDHARLLVLLGQLQAGSSTALLAEIETLAHRLAGAAATFGYPGVGNAAIALEDELLAARRTPDTGQLAGIHVKIRSLVICLETAVKKGRSC